MCSGEGEFDYQSVEDGGVEAFVYDMKGAYGEQDILRSCMF